MNMRKKPSLVDGTADIFSLSSESAAGSIEVIFSFVVFTSGNFSGLVLPRPHLPV